MEMTTIKTVAVCLVIFGCFAALYPKLFHPMLLNFFGLAEPRKNPTEGKFAPHSRNPNMGKPHPFRDGDKPDDIRKMMRGGPHPGMRAAQEMPKTQGGGSSGRGMMGVVLPMYAVGIVCYLIYTLVKVLGKKNVKTDSLLAERLKKHHKGVSPYDIRYNADKGRFTVGKEGSDESEEEMEELHQNRQDLDRLLTKAESDKISDVEMRELKRRLADTEAQLARLLTAMNGVESQTEKVAKSSIEQLLAHKGYTATKKRSPQKKRSKITPKSTEGEAEDVVENLGPSQEVTEKYGDVLREKLYISDDNLQQLLNKCENEIAMHDADDCSEGSSQQSEDVQDDEHFEDNGELDDDGIEGLEDGTSDNECEVEEDDTWQPNHTDVRKRVIGTKQLTTAVE